MVRINVYGFEVRNSHIAGKICKNKKEYIPKVKCMYVKVKSEF